MQQIIPQIILLVRQQSHTTRSGHRSDISRTVVAIMLIGSVVTGFASARVPLTQTASGVIASYSSTTSTYYSTWISYWTSTRFETKISWVDYHTEVIQNDMSGPYVRVDGTWRVVSQTRIRFDLVVKKLRDVPRVLGYAETGYVDFEILHVVDESVFAVGTCSVRFDFGPNPWRVNPDECLIADEVEISGKPLPFGRGYIRVDFRSVSRPVYGYDTKSVTALFYTFSRTLTNAYTTIYAIAPTVSEPQAFFGPTAMILVLLVVALAITAMVIRQRRKVLTSEKKEEMPAKSAMKLCIKCGYQLPADADFCSECGQRQTERKM